MPREDCISNFRYKRIEICKLWCATLIILSVGCDGSQFTVESGASFINAGNVTKYGLVPCTLSDGLNITCLKIISKAIADHPMGPWCSGGNWNNAVINYSSIAVNCNCQRNTCDNTCNDICLECPTQPQSNVYLIPITPVFASSSGAAAGDNNFGDGVALNGVPLTKADPLAFLSAANNPAPLDWYGGHATLQYVYHYHAVPTFGLTCDDGWDALNHAWATAAPSRLHSRHIGWALDGFPVFGPFSTDGVVPADVDSCYGHTHDPYGYHYHSRLVHDGKSHAFLGCFRGKTANQPGAPVPQAIPPGGGVRHGSRRDACAAGVVKTGQTQRCCGDGVCDGPEANSTCPGDCGGFQLPSGRLALGPEIARARAQRDHRCTPRASAPRVSPSRHGASATSLCRRGMADNSNGQPQTPPTRTRPRQP
jgi:hypothetical protein